MEVTPDGFPTADFAGIYKEVFATVEHHQDAGPRKTTYRGEYAGMGACDVGRADDTTEHLDVAG